ncbi:hypothetical protein GCM10010278_38190 [Streptomyces melanogenes]|nr:hypothetical protein GCM10010278_38190 [Streptomyces melanogenes]
MRKLLASRGTVKAPDMQGWRRSRSPLFLVTAVSAAALFLVSAAHMLTGVTNSGMGAEIDLNGIGRENDIPEAGRSRGVIRAAGSGRRARLQYDGVSDMTERQEGWEAHGEAGTAGDGAAGREAPWQPLPAIGKVGPGRAAAGRVDPQGTTLAPALPVGRRRRESPPHRTSRQRYEFRHQRKSPCQRTSRQWYELHTRPGAAGRPTPRPSGGPAAPDPSGLSAAATPLAAPSV